VATETASAKTTSAVPSLIRLSARRVVRVRRGIRPATAAIAVASVGATTAPSTQASGQLSPSRVCAVTATSPAVASTSSTDDSTTTRRLDRISRSDVVSDSQ
jgi:hypothetical protein